MNSFIQRMRACIAPVPLVANRAREGGERVIYDVNTLSYDKIKRNVRVKATIVADTDARALEIETKLDSALVTLGDNPLTDTGAASLRSGGGWMTDGDRHIRIAYYEIVIREGGN